MDGLDFWRLCDELTVIQAALLVAGAEPTSDAEYRAERTDKKPVGYEAARAAISSAVRRGSIKGKSRPVYDTDINGNPMMAVDNSTDVYSSVVEVDSLREWLSRRGLKTGFFFPQGAVTEDYLDPNHIRYAPKLAAAVFAWLALEDDALVKGKSPKQALSKWLREQASRFNLTDDEGKPNETGIEEAAKVANWQLTGGAPKTPAA